MSGGLKRQLQVMDEYDFEHFVADLWEQMGWQTTVSQASMDAGIDVIATKETPYPEKKVIQAKRYGDTTTVGGPDIQQYASLKHQVDAADSVIVVTTSEFTSSARERARELNVKLVDGEQLVELVEMYDAHDLVSKYVPQVHIDRPSASVADGGEMAPPTEGSKTVGPPKTDEGRLSTTVPFRPSLHWHEYVLYAIGSVVGLMFAIGILESVPFLTPIASLLALVWTGLLFSIPVAWYLDMRVVRSQSGWDPTSWQYLLGGLFLPFVAFPLYFYRRKKYV